MDANKEEIVSQAQRIAQAYRLVFGEDGHRTAEQDAVWRDLEGRAGLELPMFHPDKIGGFDALRAAHLDGARTLFIGIKRQLRIAARVETKLEDKPKTRRK